MLDLDWATFLFQLINFLVLVVGLNHFLFKPLRQKLNEREKAIADALQDARDREAEAARLRDQWQQSTLRAREEAEEILHRAQSEAEQKAASILEETRARVDRMTEEMRQDFGRQRDEMAAQYYDEILDTIVELSANVVQSVTTRRTHDDLVTNYCASIYQLPQADVDEYRRAMAGRVPTAFVTTPVALSSDQAKTLSDTLSSLIDRHIELQVRIDPELIAGIQVRLADKLIDNSVREQLRRLRQRVRRDVISRLGAKAQYGGL